MQMTTIGLDLAKHVFQAHGVDARGRAVVRKRLRRAEVPRPFAELPPCLHRHGGVRDGAPLGARADRAGGPRGPPRAAELREAVRQARRERRRRRRGDLPYGSCR